MKSPRDLAQKLARQWENGDCREALLLNQIDWPLRIPIGRPAPAVIAENWIQAKKHIEAWNAVKVGNVIREGIPYRATGEPVMLPVYWEIFNADEWVQAAGKLEVGREYATLVALLTAGDPLFHPLLVRHRSLWRDKPLSDMLKAMQLAIELESGCAHGAPLRTISLAGIDSKFFERHRNLIIRLLDIRFDYEVSEQGLEVFLDAMHESDHWLLIADLDGDILSFAQLRARSSELLIADIPAQNLLIVENERCLHMLPRNLPGAIAVLGAGNNLQWLGAPWAQRCRVAYWGDIDTWGLTLLAQARRLLPSLTVLLMNRQVFDRYALKCAVAEPIPASAVPPALLNAQEVELYNHLLHAEKGRLEQEFLHSDDVQKAIDEWHSMTDCRSVGQSDA